MMSRMILFLALAFTSVAADALRPSPGTDCRPGWIYFQGSCYAFSDTALAWWDAASVCEANEGNLVEIESAEENSWLVTRLRSSNYGTVWTGATEILHRGTFLWGKSGRRLTFSDWSPIDHQPADPPGIIEDCVEIRAPFNYQWNDNQCGIGNRFVCEAKPLAIAQ